MLSGKPVNVPRLQPGRQTLQWSTGVARPINRLSLRKNLIHKLPALQSG